MTVAKKFRALSRLEIYFSCFRSIHYLVHGTSLSNELKNIKHLNDYDYDYDYNYRETIVKNQES